MSGYSSSLHNLMAPVIESMELELVGVEYHPSGRPALLRVYIDADDGVTVDDCEAVSRQVSALLDVEDPIPGNYTLEVSSPGLDRPLFLPEHFRQFRGSRAKLQLTRPLPSLASRRRLTGVLRGMAGDDVCIEVDGQEYAVALDDIEKARLVPEA